MQRNGLARCTGQNNGTVLGMRCRDDRRLILLQLVLFHALFRLSGHLVDFVYHSFNRRFYLLFVLHFLPLCAQKETSTASEQEAEYARRPND
jgi:hypothetical protein